MLAATAVVGPAFVPPSRIARNTEWGGDIDVERTVVVERGAVLTLQPGARVAFRHYRGYREPERRLALIVRGGIVAVGTPDSPVIFTSDAPQPRNGDWSMVRLEQPTGPATFRYVVFEFAQQGLNVWRGSARIADAVFRWNNWEGLYAESSSDIEIERAFFYENGYNGLAFEQFDTITMDRCDAWRNGTSGVHVDASTLTITRSRVHDNGAHGLSVDDGGTLRALGVATYRNRAAGIGFGEGKNLVELGNVAVNENGDDRIRGPYTTVATAVQIPERIEIGFEPDMSQALGYIPGDPTRDGYRYVYSDDETRRIVRRIGMGLGLTWSLAWDGEALWTATLSGQISRLDPTTGEVLRRFEAPGPQPWGMTFDGSHLWIVDFAEKRISEVDPATGRELASFPTPDAQSGCKGVAWDGTLLNVMGWSSPTIYRMDREGRLVGTIRLEKGGGGGIAWDGRYFWVPAGRITKYDLHGHAVGWIYPASEGTWDMTWGGGFLWATQRTNENWPDAKIFALEVLDDHDPGPGRRNR